jgi:long-chain acyl-CoA synthetase
MLRNEPVTLELMLAARWLGARWCAVNWHFKADEVQGVVAESGARLLIGHADLVAAVRGVLPAGLRVFRVRPDAHTCQVFGLTPMNEPDSGGGDESWEAWRDDHAHPAVPASPAPGSGIFFTSGTTGRPKGVRYLPPTPQQMADIMHAGHIAYGLEPAARVLVSAPFYHSGPCHYAVTAALMGCDLSIQSRFDAEATLRLIEARRISHVYLVPTMYARLLRLPAAVCARHDLSSVRFVASTGAPCPPELKRRMIEWWGPVIHETYAASERGLITHIDSHDALRKPGSAGRALPGVTLGVVDEAGHDCAPGQIGTIYISSRTMPDFSYIDHPEARRAVERDGAITLGDIGYLDDEGFLFIVDRSADLVNSAGTKIYTPEVEARLLQLPGVADCAVYGVADAEFGQALVAAIELLPGARLTALQVQDHVRQHLAGYKVPRRVEFHARLPREDTGKVFKRRLRDAAV